MSNQDTTSERTTQPQLRPSPPCYCPRRHLHSEPISIHRQPEPSCPVRRRGISRNHQNIVSIHASPVWPIRIANPLPSTSLHTFTARLFVSIPYSFYRIVILLSDRSHLPIRSEELSASTELVAARSVTLLPRTCDHERLSQRQWGRPRVRDLSSATFPRPWTSMPSGYLTTDTTPWSLFARTPNLRVTSAYIVVPFFPLAYRPTTLPFSIMLCSLSDYDGLNTSLGKAETPRTNDSLQSSQQTACTKETFSVCRISFLRPDHCSPRRLG